MSAWDTARERSTIGIFEIDLLQMRNSVIRDTRVKVIARARAGGTHPFTDALGGTPVPMRGPLIAKLFGKRALEQGQPERPRCRRCPHLGAPADFCKLL